MTTTKKTSNPAPLAHRIPAEVSPVITAYAEWLTEQTGYKVDPMSVYIGSQLRSTFQKTPANQQRIAESAKARAAQDAAKAARKAEREAKVAEKTTPVPAPKPAPKRAPRKTATKGSTVHADVVGANGGVTGVDVSKETQA